MVEDSRPLDWTARGRVCFDIDAPDEPAVGDARAVCVLRWWDRTALS